MDLFEEIQKAKRVYLCGNGGSAANATHWANDLLSAGIKAQALVTDMSTLTAIGNDYGYECIFSYQIAKLGDPGDLLIALSGSGNSANIILALATAQARGMRTYSVIGNFGRGLPLALVNGLSTGWERNGANMQAAEEYQLELGHSITLRLKGVQ